MGNTFLRVANAASTVLTTNLESCHGIDALTGPPAEHICNLTTGLAKLRLWSALME